jgi:signal peptidase II
VQERGTVAPLTATRALAYAIAVVVVVLDRITTTLAEHHLHGVTHLWGPFGFALSFNSGFAFSVFAGRAVPVTIGLIVMVFVLAYVVGRVRTTAQAIGAGLVLGGAVGNLSERLVSGHSGQVADFITLTHWPTFNLADACITLGVVLIAVTLLFGRDGATHEGRSVPGATP